MGDAMRTAPGDDESGPVRLRADLVEGGESEQPSSPTSPNGFVQIRVDEFGAPLPTVRNWFVEFSFPLSMAAVMVLIVIVTTHEWRSEGVNAIRPSSSAAPLTADGASVSVELHAEFSSHPFVEPASIEDDHPDARAPIASAPYLPPPSPPPAPPLKPRPPSVTMGGLTGNNTIEDTEAAAVLCDPHYVFSLFGLDGEGKVFFACEQGSSMPSCFNTCKVHCDTNLACTGFEFNLSGEEQYKCGTYTGGQSNHRGPQDPGWMTCLHPKRNDLATTGSVQGSDPDSP